MVMRATRDEMHRSGWPLQLQLLGCASDGIFMFLYLEAVPLIDYPIVPNHCATHYLCIHSVKIIEEFVMGSNRESITMHHTCQLSSMYIVISIDESSARCMGQAQDGCTHFI